MPTRADFVSVGWSTSGTNRDCVMTGCSVGDLLVVKAGAESSATITFSTQAGSTSAWTTPQSVNNAQGCPAAIGWATVTAAGSVTVRAAHGLSQLNGAAVARYAAGTWGTVGDSSSKIPTSTTTDEYDNSTGTNYTVDGLTTQAANSAIEFLCLDWSATATDPTAGQRQEATAGTMNYELLFTGNGGNYGAHGGYYQDAGAIGAKTIGFTPLRKTTVVALEITSGTTVPGAPTGVTVVDVASATSVDLSWTAPASNGGAAITGYRVTPFISGVAQTPVNTGSTATTYTVTGLTTNTTYTFKVAAINSVGTGADSDPSAPVTVNLATAAGQYGWGAYGTASGTYGNNFGATSGTVSGAATIAATSTVTAGGMVEHNAATTIAATSGGTFTATATITLVNNFENVTPSGTTVTTGNSGGAGNTAVDAVAIAAGGGIVASDSTRAHSGSTGVKVQSSTTAGRSAVGWTTTAGTQTVVWMRTYVYVTGTMAIAPFIMRALTGSSISAGTSRCAIRYNAGGTLSLLDSTGSVITGATTTNTLATNAWNRVEVKLTLSTTAAAGSVVLRLFKGADLESATPTEEVSNTGTANLGGTADSYGYGIMDTDANVGPYWIDDIGFSTNTWVGPASDTNGAATIAATSSVTAGAMVEHNASATIASTSTVTAGGFAEHRASGTIAATGSVTAGGFAEHRASATIAATATVTPATSVERRASSTVAATATVAANGGVFRTRPWRVLGMHPGLDSLITSGNANAFKAEFDACIGFAGSPQFALYKDWFPTYSYLNVFSDGGETYEVLQLDAGGQPLWIPFAQNPDGTYARRSMDLRSSTYKSGFIQKIKDTLDAGAAGMFIDDVNMNWQSMFIRQSGVTPTTDFASSTYYTSAITGRAGWKALLADFLTDVVAQVRITHPWAKFIFNTQIFWLEPDRWTDLDAIKMIDASNWVAIEHGFADPGLQNGAGSDTGTNEYALRSVWKYLDQVHSRGKGFMVYSRGTDLATTRYETAGYLLKRDYANLENPDMMVIHDTTYDFASFPSFPSVYNTDMGTRAQTVDFGAGQRVLGRFQTGLVEVTPVTLSSAIVATQTSSETEVAADSPTAWWKLNDTSAPADDAIGTLNLAATGSPVFDGKSGVLFPATTDLLTVTDNTGPTNLTGSAWTLEFEITAPATMTAGNFPNVLSKGWATLGGWYVYVHEGNQLVNFYGNDEYGTSISLAPNETIRVAFVYNSGTLTAYKNGIAVGSTLSTTALTGSSDPFTVNGGYQGGDPAGYRFSDIAIYNTALSGSRLRVHYVGGANPPITGAATIAGTSSVSATGKAEHNAAATIIAATTVTADTSVVHNASVTIAAASSVAPNARREANCQATIAAASTVTAGGFVERQASATISAQSTVTAGGYAEHNASATIAATSGGTFTGYNESPGSATIAGTSNVTADGRVDQTGGATIAGQSSISANALLERFAAATIAATTTVTAQGYAEHNAATAVPGLSGGTIVGRAEHNAQATIAATSNATVDSSVEKRGSTTIAAQSSIVAESHTSGVQTGSATIAAQTTVSPTGQATLNASVTIGGVSSGNYAGAVERLASLAITANSEATVVGRSEQNAQAILTSGSTVSATPFKQANGEAVIAASSSVTASGDKSSGAGTSMSGQSDVTATATVESSGQSIISSTSNVSVSGFKIAHASITIAATSNVNASVPGHPINGYAIIRSWSTVTAKVSKVQTGIMLANGRGRISANGAVIGIQADIESLSNLMASGTVIPAIASQPRRVYPGRSGIRGSRVSGGVK